MYARPRLSGFFVSAYLSRMRMYVSGRYVEQGVHKYVCTAVLGWVGTRTEAQLVSSCMFDE